MTAITAAEIRFRGSTTSGAAGNATAFGGPDTSLGKYITNADLPDATLNSLFIDATGAENAASTAAYQCMFVYNSNANNPYLNATIWVSGDPAGGAAVAIGADTTGASALGSASAQALQIANKNTAPAGVTFSTPTSFATGINLGNIPAGQVKAFWIRRALANTVALNNDGITISIQGDTAAA